ncbi:MAG: hypothetical protein AAB383_03400 [Patescibacteria group bacterium]
MASHAAGPNLRLILPDCPPGELVTIERPDQEGGMTSIDLMLPQRDVIATVFFAGRETFVFWGGKKMASLMKRGEPFPLFTELTLCLDPSNNLTLNNAFDKSIEYSHRKPSGAELAVTREIQYPSDLTQDLPSKRRMVHATVFLALGAALGLGAATIVDAYGDDFGAAVLAKLAELERQLP